jgi:hypothetical protein
MALQEHAWEMGLVLLAALASYWGFEALDCVAFILGALWTLLTVLLPDKLLSSARQALQLLAASPAPQHRREPADTRAGSPPAAANGEEAEEAEEALAEAWQRAQHSLQWRRFWAWGLFLLAPGLQLAGNMYIVRLGNPDQLCRFLNPALLAVATALRTLIKLVAAVDEGQSALAERLHLLAKRSPFAVRHGRPSSRPACGRHLSRPSLPDAGGGDF